MEEVLHIHIGYVHAHKGLLLLQRWGQAGHWSVHENSKKKWGKWCQQVARMEEEVHSAWLWLGESGRTWATHCSEDQTQITFDGTCPSVVHFFDSHLLLNLCRVCFSAAAYCSLFSSESHTLLNQMPYEGYYFSIIILVNKTHNLLKEGNQVLFGKACFQQNQLVQHPLRFCHLFLVVKNFWVCWFIWVVVGRGLLSAQPACGTP